MIVWLEFMGLEAVRVIRPWLESTEQNSTLSSIYPVSEQLILMFLYEIPLYPRWITTCLVHHTFTQCNLIYWKRFREWQNLWFLCTNLRIMDIMIWHHHLYLWMKKIIVKLSGHGTSDKNKKCCWVFGAW